MFAGSRIEKKNISGLDTLLVNKKGFLENYILLSVGFGGVDSHSHYDWNRKIPYGTAHFLEHLIIQNSQFDAIHEFGEIGASLNASTNFESTSFAVSCTEQLELNIKMILKLVQSISITNESVEKEKKIIKQEILQLHSNRRTSCYTNLLSDLYGEESGLAQPIIGNLESVESMDACMLEMCFHKFYAMENMKIIIIGDLNPEEAHAVIKLELENSALKDKERYLPFIPVKRESMKIEAINSNQSVLSWGNATSNGRDAGNPDRDIRKEFSIRIGLEILFGRTSEFQQKIHDHGFVDGGIDVKYEISDRYCFSSLSTITTKPSELMEEIHTTKKEVRKKSISDVEFLISKRRIIGRIIDVYDHPAKLANSILDYSSRGLDFSDVLDVINTITKKEVIDALHSHILN
ncbi:M16 family metallopeptidase [Peribacillus muralis]|uniref:M16 family metallopeptidase n=1 Tax=Peribacillus muralis TaxID=264697 RepID=UPI003D019D88